MWETKDTLTSIGIGVSLLLGGFNFWVYCSKRPRLRFLSQPNAPHLRVTNVGYEKTRIVGVIAKIDGEQITIKNESDWDDGVCNLEPFCKHVNISLNFPGYVNPHSVTWIAVLTTHGRRVKVDQPVVREILTRWNEQFSFQEDHKQKEELFELLRQTNYSSKLRQGLKNGDPPANDIEQEHRRIEQLIGKGDHSKDHLVAMIADLKRRIKTY